jgi:hypothetical protein
LLYVMAMIETINAPSAIANETTAVAIAKGSRRRNGGGVLTGSG